MVQNKLAFLFLTSILLQVQSCNLKVSAFRAYQDNFVVFDISYEGNPRSIGIKLSVDQPVLNIENINGIDYLKSNISRHDINLQPYHLRVGDKIYYKLFLETQDGRGNCETVIDEIQIQAMTDDPRFSEPIPNVTVALGRDASLPCVVENLGTYKVAWIHIDRQMILTIHRHVISRVPRFSVSHDNAKTWLLHVSSVQQEDRGYYMCQVNTNPMISQVGYLQVVVPPNILDTESTQSTVAVRENQNISLTCKADGFPTPKIMWRREDGQAISVERRKKVNVYDGEQLNLTRISRTEMGAYLCIATNGVPPSVSKRIIVDVEFSPMIWVPNQLVGAPAGTDVTIDCHTEAYPRAISYWVYDNVMLLPTKKYGTDTAENSYRAHMKLTVRNLQPGDFGNYRCISKNSLGETEGSIRLYEIPMPSTPPRATEMKSSSNKESVGKRNSTRPVVQDERPKVVMVSSSDKRDSQPDSAAESGLGSLPPPGPQGSGCVCISRWAAPQLAVVTLHFILSGPIIHN